MAIRPISVSNYYNSVPHFEGDKRGKKKTPPLKSSSSMPLAAIPLATFLAMSPLNSSAQDKNLVSSQGFDFGKGFYEEKDSLHLKYYDLNGDNADIENIRAESNETGIKLAVKDELNFRDIYGDVKSINKCNYNVVGDDGVSVGTWAVSYVTLNGQKGSGQYLMRPEIVNALEEFANSDKNNGAVEINNFDKNLQIGYSSVRNPSNIRKLNGEYIFNTQQNFGEKLEEFNLETSIDKYNLTLYESGDFVVERLSDGFKGIVEKARELDVQIISPDYYNDEQAQIGCIDLKWPNAGKYTILEPGLYSALLQIKEEYPKIGKAYETTVETYPVTLTDDGYMFKY